ncbi:MAG: zinc ribbon domain-containing protein [Oscillospiraceae bacterium]|nr:zinc ribbon domain-containing protein [Oscillospiraceae bacterium]
MKFCQKCGKQLLDDARFCEFCGTAVIENDEDAAEIQPVTEESDVEITREEVVSEQLLEKVFKKKFVLTKKLMAILACTLAGLVVIGVVIGNAISQNKYKEKLEAVYDDITYGAEKAESHASLQSKVWRNCIYEQSSSETDKYTKNEYGSYYSDFNDALASFYEGESLTYSLVSLNVSSVDAQMSKLKDCPKKYEDEYKALKELYVSYSELADLVIGNSSYSWTTFSEALESAKSDYKSALSSARLLLD